MTYRPHDGVEEELFAALRADPRDDEVRAVYADWLEEHGFEQRAELLRTENAAVAEDGDHAWRAVVSRPRIERCSLAWLAELALTPEEERTGRGVDPSVRCPRNWALLLVTADDFIRRCGVCDAEVHYCATLSDARRRQLEGRCVVVDAAVVRQAKMR